MIKRGFDAEKYIRLEKSAISKRISKFDKLYLEVGGKICYDFHASRVLPGYIPTTKLQLLKQLKNKEIIYCINAKDLERKRIIHDFNFVIDKHALNDLKILKKFGIKVNFIVITLFSGQKSALRFKRILEAKGYSVYFHGVIKRYPNNIKNVLNGFGKQTYIPVKKSLVVVLGAASNSGKMAVALCQMYHESKRRIKTGFAKIETFPIWNLSLEHPINLAYESATADLGDKNMIDPYHLKAYGKTAINYNRDIENFSILKIILSRVSKNSFYKSPTDMGLNMAGFAIVNDDVCRTAAIKELERRCKQYYLDYKRGHEKISTLRRAKEILEKVNEKIYF
ncbi:MAG: DUF1846 domain-containing protein [Nanoarchaeota archaeon]